MKIEKDGKTFYVCECGKEFEKRKAFIGHCSRCEKHLGHKPTNNDNLGKWARGNKKKNTKYKDKNYNEPGNCQYCGRKCKNQNALKQHEIRCKKNPDKIDTSKSWNNGNRPAWNKGKSKETNKSVLKASKTLSKTLKTKYKEELKQGIKRKQPKWVKDKISASMVGKNIDSQEHNQMGTCKCGYYKDIFCASSYELAYLIYCLDHNIDIKRNKKSYRYKYKGKEHNYFPDFVINDKVLIEIKGKKSRIVNIKAKAVNDLPIRILYRKDLEHIFDYIYLTYNKLNLEVIELYDDYSIRYKKKNGRYIKKKLKKG